MSYQKDLCLVENQVILSWANENSNYGGTEEIFGLSLDGSLNFSGTVIFRGDRIKMKPFMMSYRKEILQMAQHI